MEGGPFLDARVRKQFQRFVIVVLHTDGGEAAAKNTALLRSMFKTRSIPLYAAMDPTGTRAFWTGGVVRDPAVLAAELAKVPRIFHGTKE
jgi:hypothetical protein